MQLCQKCWWTCVRRVEGPEIGTTRYRHKNQRKFEDRILYDAARGETSCSDLHFAKRDTPRSANHNFFCHKIPRRIPELNLELAGLECSMIYGSMDTVARQNALLRFRKKKVNILLVTDVASRGIDIPLLDNTINYDFPTKSKIFVHRVGRVARQGRVGTAVSMVSTDEIPYMLDLYMFLAREPVNAANVGPADSVEDKISRDRNCGEMKEEDCKSIRLATHASQRRTYRLFTTEGIRH